MKCFITFCKLFYFFLIDLITFTFRMETENIMSRFSFSEFTFTNEARDTLRKIVTEIHNECPGQTQNRYLSRISYHKNSGDMKDIFPNLISQVPLLLRNLPLFDEIEKSKILLLLTGEATGRCVAYSEYNQSYITDIRPTSTSAELSSGTELLSMHNDLCFASDRCRPERLVLLPHVTDGVIPKTLLATSQDIKNGLSEEDIKLLSGNNFEMRAGGKLLWPNEEIRKLKIFEDKADGSLKIKMNFSNIRPAATLDKGTFLKCEQVLEKLSTVALEVGLRDGHQILKGEALIIPNDTVVHGRDVFASENVKRLLLRSYVVSQNVVDAHHGNTMLSLRY
ncbi:hypothetical protein BSQ99_12770 [Serratia liquefaciens]|nr:hypothetical protein BSQ99_12770 [Serratia liquefaciens]